MRTRWRLGSKRRLVATIEWLRLCPNAGAFPQTWHTLDIAGEYIPLLWPGWLAVSALPQSGSGGSGAEPGRARAGAQSFLDLEHRQDGLDRVGAGVPLGAPLHAVQRLLHAVHGEHAEPS